MFYDRTAYVFVRELRLFFEKGAWPWSRDPLNFWALNANSSKTVKATDFKFDVHVTV